jgi:hypothetical protein
MKTTDFLRELLPESGIYYAATWVDKQGYGPRNGYFKHVACSDVADLTPELNHFSRTQRKDAYMALASYAEASYEDPQTGKVKRRTRENAVATRAMWLDLDVGAEKAYPTQGDALKALLGFVTDCELPKPTHLVNSGYGIHAYWAFTKDIPKTTWEQFAKTLKALAEFKGLGADPSRTADISSVLRPIGTRNYKDPDNPREVTLLRRTDPIRFSDFGRRLAELQQTLGLKIKRASQTPGKNKSLEAQGPLPASDAHQLADRCPTLGSMRDSLGANQDEPLWYACLGVLAFTQQGDEICHAWSDAHDAYDYDTCQGKIDQVRAGQSGPTSCSVIRTRGGPGCAGCTHKGDYSISLGYPDAPQALVEPETGEALPQLPEVMRDGSRYYTWYFDPGFGLVEVTPGAEGEPPKKNKIAEQFVVIDFVYKETAGNGNPEFMAQIRTRARPGQWDACKIPVASIASTAATLGAVLGKAGVTGHSEGLKRYMQTWYEQLRKEVDPRNMRKSMGWQEDGSFALGTDLFKPDGTVEPCTLSKELEHYADGHVPRGTLERQVEILNNLYDRTGMEARQFVLVSSLGSILLPMLHKGAIGVPIAIWEPDGGQGKTTVAQEAIGVWGDPHAHAQGTHSGRTTEYAKYVVAGIRRHLPVLIDETTMMADPKEVARFAYDYSSGQAKLQGAAEGGLRKNQNQNWQNFLYMTGNKSLTGVMTASIPNCGPQLARIFEIQFNKLQLSSWDDSPLIEESWNHTGHIGRVFLKAVVKRQDTVLAMLQSEMERLRKYVDTKTDARYWLMTAACVSVAARIAGKLGLFSFDMDRLVLWTEHQLHLLRGEHTESMHDTEELLAQMFGDLQGGVLITDKLGSRSSRCRISTEFPPPRGKEILGRYCVEEGWLYISVSAAKQWCTKSMLDYKDFRDRLMAIHRLIKHDDRLYLTVGTSMGGVAQTRCWKIHAPNLPLRAIPEVDYEDEDADTSACV